MPTLLSLRLSSGCAFITYEDRFLIDRSNTSKLYSVCELSSSSGVHPLWRSILRSIDCHQLRTYSYSSEFIFKFDHFYPKFWIFGNMVHVYMYRPQKSRIYRIILSQKAHFPIFKKIPKKCQKMSKVVSTNHRPRSEGSPPTPTFGLFI